MTLSFTLTGAGESQQYVLANGESMKIGRSPQNEFVVGHAPHNKGISKLHAKIRNENNELFIEDKSVNGTALQYAGCDPTHLAVGVQVKLGQEEAHILLNIHGGQHQQESLKVELAEVPTAVPSSYVPTEPLPPQKGLSAGEFDGLLDTVKKAVASGVAETLADTIEKQIEPLRQDATELRAASDEQKANLEDHENMIRSQASALYKLGEDMDNMKKQLAQQPQPSCTVFLFKANLYVQGGAGVTWKETRGVHNMFITAGSASRDGRYVDLSTDRDRALAGASDVSRIWIVG